MTDLDPPLPVLVCLWLVGRRERGRWRGHELRLVELMEESLLLIPHGPLEVVDVGVHDVRAGLAGGDQREGGASSYHRAGGQPQAGGLLTNGVVVVVVDREPGLDVNSQLITLSVIAC